MHPRQLRERVQWVGAVDWDRRLFDALIPLPEGTSYNAYLVRGSDRTALLDTVDPAKTDLLLSNLEGLDRLDYVVCHHGEQDHSGSLPAVLARFPMARPVASTKGVGILADHLGVPADRFLAVEDRQTLSLGDRTLQFYHTPWVHWPETMCTYVPEDRILFSCDFFGSHLATSDLYSAGGAEVLGPAKRYFAEIMMPFRAAIQKNLEAVGGLDIEVIAPSHGPMHDRPRWIMDAYADWVSPRVANQVVIPYVSMHGSVEKLVTRLVAGLVDRGVGVRQFNLAATDLGELAAVLVDAATLVAGTPTVLVGPHPSVLHAAALANALRPKTRFVSVLCSYGWAGKAVETLTGLLTNLKAEVLAPVLCKGAPREEDYRAVDELAGAIAAKHQDL